MVQYIPHFISIIGMGFILISINRDNICRLGHKQCDEKINHSDIKYQTTLNKLFSVVSINFLP